MLDRLFRSFKTATANHDDCWGPSLDIYLGSIQSYIPHRRPDRKQLRKSYQTFLEYRWDAGAPSSVTCSVLEDVLLLCLCFPKQILELTRAGSGTRTAWSMQMITPIYRALEGYTKTNQLFDHYFGFLCVQILALSIHVDALVRHDRLQRVLKDIPAGSEPQYISHALANSAIRTMVELGWPGGIDQQHHGFLLSILWSSRKSLSHVCEHVPGLHGWMILFAAIWVPLRDHMPVSSGIPITCQLYNLTCRYALVAKEDTTLLIPGDIASWVREDVAKWNPAAKIHNFDLDPEDREELPHFRDILTARLTHPGNNRLDRPSVVALVEFVVCYYFRSAKSFESTGSFPLFEAVIKRWWMEIEDIRCLVDVEDRAIVLKMSIGLLQFVAYPFRIFFLINEQNGGYMDCSVPTVSSFLARVLDKGDCIDLMGRLLLLIGLPLRRFDDLQCSAFYYSESQSYDMQELLIACLRQYCDLLEKCDGQVAEILSPRYYDWKKTNDFLKMRGVGFINAISSRYYDDVCLIWRRLGNALGFRVHSARWCAYVGCLGGVVENEGSTQACGGCLVTVYCSRKCQELDWNRQHRLQCSL